MIPKIAEKIRVELAKRNKNVAWLSEQTNIKPPNLYRILERLENNTGVRIDTLEKIGKALDLNFFAE